MDLQNTFYTLASIAMILFIVFLLIALWTIFYIRRQMSRIREAVIARIIAYTKPVDVAKGIGTSIITNFLLRIRDNLRFG